MLYIKYIKNYIIYKKTKNKKLNLFYN
jgi:hypothetical protein